MQSEPVPGGIRGQAREEPTTSIDMRIEALAIEVGLSGRELEVLRLIARGYRYREIALAIAIAPRTVKMHAASVRKKVSAVSRWDLMQRVLAA
jgi:DNA-binding CsgD family transcriptional regulator